MHGDTVVDELSCAYLLNIAACWRHWERAFERVNVGPAAEWTWAVRVCRNGL